MILANADGKAIGVAVATFKGGQNLNFALPVNLLRDVPPTTIAFTAAKPVPFDMRDGDRLKDLVYFNNIIEEFGVFAEGLTLDDRADMYAMVVSHELAELVVDPNIDGTNPEVCDPCDLNCGPLHRCYFDSADRYVGSTARLPPPFAYSYYICAIVKPTAAAKCPASSASCDYAPSSARAKVNVKRR